MNDYVKYVCIPCLQKYRAKPTEGTETYQQMACEICERKGWAGDTSDHPWFSFRRVMLSWTDKQLKEHHKNIIEMNPDGPKLTGPSLRDIYEYDFIQRNK